MDSTAHTPRQLGQLLQGCRKALRLTQGEAAEKVGLLPKTISRLERATETATVESLFKLLSSLQLELSVRTKPQERTDGEW